jgi:CheY-like chemotaxis protein
MPGLDGCEASRVIRREEKERGARPTPIIALTANAMESDRRACLAAGIDEFLVKPVELAKLAETIDAVRLASPVNRAALS